MALDMLNPFLLWRPAISNKTLSTTAGLNEASLGKFSTTDTALFVSRIGIITTLILTAVKALTYKHRLSAVQLGALSLPFLPLIHKVVKWQGERGLDQQACDFFLAKNPRGEWIQPLLMSFLATHPGAVEKIRRAQPSTLKYLTAENGDTLLTEVLKESNSSTDQEILKKFEVFKILALVPDLITKETFTHVLKTKSPEYALHILEKKLIQAEYYSNQEQLNLWKKVKDARIARALVKNGFNINVADNFGNTPLRNLFLKLAQKELHKREADSASADLSSHKESLFSLLTAGAHSFSLKEVFTFPQKQGIARLSLENALHNQPKILSALSLAPEKDPTFMSDEITPTWNFLQPPIKISDHEGIFGVNKAALRKRVTLVAFVALVVTSSQFFLLAKKTDPAVFQKTMSRVASIFALHILIPMGAALFWDIYERSRARELLTGRAAHEIQTPFYPQSVTEYILANPRVLQTLKKDMQALRKPDDHGNTLWQNFISKDSPEAKEQVFPLLADIFLDNASLEDKQSFVSEILSNDEYYFTYLLENMRLEKSFLDEKTISLLQKKGCKVEKTQDRFKVIPPALQ